MFDATRQEGAGQIAALARQIAVEVSNASKRHVEVIGWRGSGGKMDWEYLVEIDGISTTLEVGDADLLAFPSDASVRSEVAERIRCQMARAAETLR